jgi:hypothetical protein
MNPNTTKRKRAVRMLFMIGLFFPTCLQAQERDIVEFLKAGQGDATKLMNAYLNPTVEGLSYGFNGGWFHTAKAHKTLGIDLGVSVQAVFIPSSKNYFKPGELGLELTEMLDPNTLQPIDGKAPTMVGPKDPTTYGIDLNENGTYSSDETFRGPEGLDFKENVKVSAVPAATAQLGIGIYKNTDLKIRWMPEVEAGDSKVKLIGFGVMHDIKQHIPGIKLLPFDLSILAAFTKVNGSTKLSGVFDSGGDTRPQKMDYEMNAWLIQALISKKLSVITFYGGVGYNAIKTTADVTGSYDIFDTGVAISDPVSLSFKNSGFRATAGMRLKLAVIYLTTDYTLQEYSTLSVGLGITVR